MILSALFALFAAIGLLAALLDFGAKANSPAPSMYRSDVSFWGMLTFIICGLMSLAAFFSFGAPS